MSTTVGRLKSRTWSERRMIDAANLLWWFWCLTERVANQVNTFWTPLLRSTGLDHTSSRQQHGVCKWCPARDRLSSRAAELEAMRIPKTMVREETFFSKDRRTNFAAYVDLWRNNEIMSNICCRRFVCSNEMPAVAVIDFRWFRFMARRRLRRLSFDHRCDIMMIYSHMRQTNR